MVAAGQHTNSAPLFTIRDRSATLREVYPIRMAMSTVGIGGSRTTW